MMKDSKYYKKKLKKQGKDDERLSILFSKLLLAVIFVLGSLVLTNFSSSLKDKYVKEVLEKNIDISYINKFYNKYIGRGKKEEEEVLVANLDSSKEYEKVGESVKFTMEAEEPITTLEGGIIVFIGDKDDLGNTVIVQGNDGIDIWYSNILMTDYSLYDYVSKGDKLGVSMSDNYLVTIKKDDKTLEYEEYIS